jgi:hypothetical protein
LGALGASAHCLPPINQKQFEARMFASPPPTGAGRLLLCKPSEWKVEALVHLQSRAAELPLAQQIAREICAQLRPFYAARVAAGLPPPPPITVTSPQPGVVSARFAMAPGDSQAAALSRALASLLECSELDVEEESHASTITFHAGDELRIHLTVPNARVRCCTLEISGTHASLGKAAWLAASAFSMAHTLSMQADGSTAVLPGAA